jgi:hypothetical protein
MKSKIDAALAGGMTFAAFVHVLASFSTGDWQLAVASTSAAIWAWCYVLK